MDIKYLSLPRLQNEEHFEFHTEFKDLVIRFAPGQLNIAQEFNSLYLPLYSQEDEAFKLIRKSSLTARLAASDEVRDRAINGITRLVEAYTYHFIPEWAEAAQRLKVILDAYGHVARKSYDKETADITNLLQDFDSHVADSELLNLRDWIEELNIANNAFAELLAERYTESADKTELRMKNVRKEIDSVYSLIVQIINARITIEGEEMYAPFVRELNLRIDHYNTLIAQRRGISRRNRTKEA